MKHCEGSQGGHGGGLKNLRCQFDSDPSHSKMLGKGKEIHRLPQEATTKETLHVDGLGTLVREIKKIRPHCDLLIIGIDGPPGVGKGTFSTIISNNILQNLDSDDLDKQFSISLPFEKGSEPHFQYQLDRGIIGTDLALVDRTSPIRKDSHNNWYRFTELMNAINKSTIKDGKIVMKFNTYDSKTGIVSYHDNLTVQVVNGCIIIEGKGAFFISEQLNRKDIKIAKMNILVVANEEEQIERILERASARGRDKESTLEDYKTKVKTAWERYWSIYYDLGLGALAVTSFPGRFHVGPPLFPRYTELKEEIRRLSKTPEDLKRALIQLNKMVDFHLAN